jgi:hypothetical protein
MDKELEEILLRFSDSCVDETNMLAGLLDKRDYQEYSLEQAKTDLLALITKENNKARLDELEHAYVGLADIVSTNITGTPESIEERIDSIKRRIKE